jgi:hypothetical protein
VYLCGAVLSSVALVAGARPWWARIVLVVLATVCCAVLTRRRELGIRPVLVAIGVVTGAAVFFGPRESPNVWSYADYGRMLAVHGVSPYLHTPSQFPHDPLFHLVGWRNTPSVYGPVFNAFAALEELVAGLESSIVGIVLPAIALVTFIAVARANPARLNAPSGRTVR